MLDTSTGLINSNPSGYTDPDMLIMVTSILVSPISNVLVCQMGVGSAPGAVLNIVTYNTTRATYDGWTVVSAVYQWSGVTATDPRFILFGNTTNGSGSQTLTITSHG